MKLLSPVDKIEEVEKLIQAGADEFYCGLLTSDWHNKYIAGAINRRPGGGANFTTFDELQTCVSLAHSHAVPVFLTLNEHYYTPKQYPFILDYVARVVSIGVDALLVADLALLLTLKQMNINTRIIISTGGNAFNSETVRFYQDLGASRIILPRHLTLEEINALRNNVSDIELETFILNSRCPNVDGFCTFQHGLADQSIKPLYENACMLPYDISVTIQDDIEQGQISWKRQHIWQTVHVDDYPCGACALYELDRMNIASVKIVGRGNPTARKIADIIFIRSLLDSLENEKPTQKQFHRMAQKLYRETYNRPCRVYMCYYPEALVEKWNRQYSSQRLKT
jgi:collagenase-like PrtC family protease